MDDFPEMSSVENVNQDVRHGAIVNDAHTAYTSTASASSEGRPDEVDETASQPSEISDRRPEPKDRSRRSSWNCPSLFVVAALLTVVLIIAVVGGIVMRPAGPAETLERYFSALGVDNVEAAYGLLCSEIQSEMSFDEFAALVNGAIEDAGEIDGFSIGEPASAQDGAVTVPYELSPSKFQEPTAMDARLVGQDNGWRICDFGTSAL